MKDRLADQPKFWLVCLGLVMITSLGLYPALLCEFTLYDDFTYVTQNPHLQAGLGWGTLQWAFTSFYASNWHPLTWLSHALDIELFGLKPWGHHLTNLLLHFANTLLIFHWLGRMTGS